MKNVIVNATALNSGGALTILRQFISYASLTSDRYYIFCPVGLFLENHKNINYIEINSKSWLKRILWDGIGLKRYLNRHNILCDICISLQNTSINIECEQIIYLHQPLPFTNICFEFTLQNLKYFLYKWFYKFFVFLFVNSKTRFVVQTQWMKTALAQCGVSLTKISVFTPDIKLPEQYLVQEMEQTDSRTTENITFFYPASSLFYKNHLLILDALVLLNAASLIKKANFAVTLSLGDHPKFDGSVKRLGLEGNIVYLGKLPYAEVIKNYIFADAVLFPSYIETFGLPLAEAGVLGKKIICADLPYSRDVLSGYQGVSFLDYQNAEQWADEMALVIQKQNSLKYTPLSFDKCTTWKDFFNFI